MAKVTFVREGLTVEITDKMTILDVMRQSGLHPDAPCGGKGKCGKCTVGLAGGKKVLACQTMAQDGMEVDTLPQAEGAAQILTQAMGAGTVQTQFCPMVRQLKIRMRPCPAGESISDWDRYMEAVRESAAQDPAFAHAHGKSEGRSVHSFCRKRRQDTIPALASKIGPLSRKTKGEFFTVLFGMEPLEVSENEVPVYMAAFDIGTTTVAGYLLDSRDGSTAATASCMNPQSQFGADVINRANYSLEHGMEEISACIRSAVQELLEEMAGTAGASLTDIYAVSVAGNTCMHHLFLGICVDSLVHAPYNPAVSGAMILQAADYGLNVHPKARLLMLPNIAGFVGADTVACLVATKLAEQDDWTLLIDIGTNGEMVLGKAHQMAACSTAAGPAFEGAGISCGMRGSAGAISKVRWEEDHWVYETVGGVPPRGICGSGLLDLAAQLLLSGQMDETGQMEEQSITLAPAAESGTGEDVTILQKDIRQLQLAKAAISSGVHLLAKKMGIALDQIRQVWLAGAFGSFLSPESACTIGLIPEELRGRITAVGNAAGEGARQVLLDRKLWRYAQETAREADFLELASMPEFQDMFVDEILFPEQD